ncbi:centrosomal protein of 41 kDa [Megalobrama amblycephala]|uniref:centrosomal protein of 41 kDa n=1 Tax=Megalobrama amblycephala TaxID=75352 RepID=UPI0020144A9B|nr:centrosomal protein of 41 kDa [Megalobrama amblycephala]XP_048013739.1 centrosomal protein of 41 kDa [Megalobrama amblycephala]
MSVKRAIGDSEFLKKRIPQNPKYLHVKTRLDTGYSLTKYMERLEETRKNYRYKKDELFKRLKVTTFAQLVLQVASVSDQNDNIKDEMPGLDDDVSIFSASPGLDRLSDQTNCSPEPTLLNPQSINNDESGDNGFSSRSTLQSVISGVGEMDLDKNGQKTIRLSPVSTSNITECPFPDCPYLLLDVRDREQYDQCHIISAYSYPIATLSRTMNPYTKEVLDYKNTSGKIIILYDEDERIASQAATTMCERGFENLFMLSGGLKVVAQKFPEGMTTGSIPISCLPSPPGPGGRKRSVPQQTSQAAEKKWRFTSEDLNKIQHYLEEVFIPSEPSSRLSSRMSTSSARSKASTARSSRQGSSIVGSESARSRSSRPWK